MANGAIVEKRHDVLVRFMRALKRTSDWMYAEPEVLAWYAADNNVTIDQARRAVEQFEPREATRLGSVTGLDISMQQAIEFKRIDKPLSKPEIDRMTAIVDPAK